MPKSKTLDPTEQFQIKWGKIYIYVREEGPRLWRIDIRHNLGLSLSDWNWVNQRGLNCLVLSGLTYLQKVRGIKSPLSPNVPQGLQFEEKVCVQVLPEIVSGERILVCHHGNETFFFFEEVFCPSKFFKWLLLCKRGILLAKKTVLFAL